MYDLETLRRDALSRRSFLARMSAAGLGAAAIALLDGCDGTKKVNPKPNPVPTGNGIPDQTNFPNITGRNINDAVLNYALTLERLEANLYLQALNAASGRALNTALDSGTIAAGSTGNYALKIAPGTISAQFVQPAFLYLVQFAYVEAAHYTFLATALGANAAPLTSTSGKYKFATADGTPGADLTTILTNVYPLEETGVRAYLGAAGFLTDETLVQTAATIYSTECRHSASLAYLLGLDPGPSKNIAGVPAGEQEVQPATAPNVFEKFLAPPVVLAAASKAYFA